MLFDLLFTKLKETIMLAITPQGSVLRVVNLRGICKDVAGLDELPQWQESLHPVEVVAACRRWQPLMIVDVVVEGKGLGKGLTC